MGWLEDKITKWARLIDERVGTAAREEILAGRDSLTAANAEERAAWSRGAMEKFARLVPDAETRAHIMTARSCVFVEEFGDDPLLALRALYRKTGDVDAVVAALHADGARHGVSYREGNVILEVKNPADADALATAQTPYERQIARCYCPLARAATTPVPAPYCCCGAGWYKGIWEFILEKPVTVAVRTAVMRGDDTCSFAVTLPAGVSRRAPGP